VRKVKPEFIVQQENPGASSPTCRSGHARQGRSKQTRKSLGQHKSEGRNSDKLRFREHATKSVSEIRKKPEARNPKDKPAPEQFCVSGFGFRISFGLRALSPDS
jgi:hypothetical protein